jgi:AraC-like DNA-binding protein
MVGVPFTARKCVRLSSPRFAVTVFLIVFYDVTKCDLAGRFDKMPRIIRKALYLKLKELPELQRFQQDFELLGGMRLAFVDDLGLGIESAEGGSPMCAAMRESGAGCTMCARTRHALLAQATNHPAAMACDAGLMEVAIPVNISGIRAGYFLFFGFASASPNAAAAQRVRHLLRHHGIEMDAAGIETLLSRAPIAPQELAAVYQRMAQLAIHQIALRITDQLVDAEVTMPPAVTKACGFIRAHALGDDLNLGVVARHCAISEGHLSRIFHRATGLTFREYLTQVRVEHAKALLLRGSQSVTEIAYDSGFQSLSQFHRAFLKAHGTSPGKLRAARMR